MAIRRAVRLIGTVLSVPFLVVLYFNIENLAARLGLDNVLADVIAPKNGRQPVIEFFQEPVVLWASLFGLGVVAGLWIDVWLRGLEPKRSNRKPRDKWSTTYSKVRAMHKIFQALKDADDPRIPDSLPMEFLAVCISLRSHGIAVPPPIPRQFGAKIIELNWTYLSVICPLMRERHYLHTRFYAFFLSKFIKREVQKLRSLRGTEVKTQP